MVVFDQGTKLWAVNNLSALSSVEEAKGFLEFNLIYNRGGALGTNFGSSNYYLISGFLILAFLLFYIYHNRIYPVYSWPLSIIAGGAIGNIIDRIRLGKVIDFIDVDFFDIGFLGITRWWTFNIADAAISCSIVFLIVFILFFHKRFFADTMPPSNEV